MAQASPSARFPSTAWSCVGKAQDPTHPQYVAAVNRLVTAYWKPVFHYLRAKGHSAQDAEDFTQEFFFNFLARGWLQRADQARGRFRDYLRTLVKRFAYDQTARAPAQKQFEQRFVSVHSLVQDSDRAGEPPAGETPEQAFDRLWKTDVPAAAHRSLRVYYHGLNDSDALVRYQIFAAVHLREAGTKEPTQEALAARFGVTRDKVRYALKEVLARFERLLRQELRDQVGSEADIEEELRGLA